MFREEREKGVFESLRESMLAESMIELLDNMSTERTLASSEKRVLGRAIKFFQLAKKGKDFTETLELGNYATESCSAYGRSLKALNSLVKAGPTKQSGRPAEIDSFFSKTILMLREAKNSGELQPDRGWNNHGTLRDFFQALANTLLEENVRVPEEVSIGRGPTWKEI